jgi:methionyl-tRNA synthetase
MGGGNGFLLHEALQAVWRTVSRGNEYVDRQAPWKLAKNPAMRAELDETLASLVRQLARQALHLYPFMPQKSQELWTALGAPGSPADMHFGAARDLSASGWRVTKTDPLFPKREPAAG